jgi:hypothetical protein
MLKVTIVFVDLSGFPIATSQQNEILLAYVYFFSI